MNAKAKKWEILHKDKGLRIKDKKDIVSILLKNRGLKMKKEVEDFLHPKLEDVTVKSVGINKQQLAKAVARIRKAIKNKEQIIVYGDYDVDGICGSAILWETLHGLGANVLPYIPHRVEEGYGLSIVGISNIKDQISNTKLIITVDNGIVANDAVDFANKNGVDVIITDHHVPSKKLPKALAIVHTTKLCGTGVAYLLSQEVRSEPPKASLARGGKLEVRSEDHLELVALATIADLVPLLGANRTLTTFGLEKLRKTKRIGLLALFKEAGIQQSLIGTYEVGHLIAPRLNAMGRLESAMDSLRLLCTKDRDRAENLAHTLGTTNRERQVVTEETVIHARSAVRGQSLEVRKLLFISHESYQQGVIGLVAGKLVEEFYRPAIVIAKGEKVSKASARSVHGLNIIEFIRSASEFLVDAGGHPMAAGFTVETEKLPALQKALEERAEKLVLAEMLTRTLRVDCEIAFTDINRELYQSISTFEPFGMANPQPSFVSRNVMIKDMRLVGADGRHAKLRLSQQKPVARSQQPEAINAIAFGFGQRASELHVGDTVDIVCTIDEDRWNGNRKLQLKIKDIRRENSS